MLSKIKSDIFQAMRDKDTVKRNVLQIVRGSITNLAHEKRVDEENLDNSDIIDVIAKERKQQTDSYEAFVLGKRDDLANTASRNIEILTSYLPVQLGTDDIKEIIVKVLNELEIEEPTRKDIGPIMKRLMPLIKGRSNGNTVNLVLGTFIKI